MRWMANACALALMAVAGTAQAGDIYVCKGADGVKRFQDVPCAKPADAVKHQQYDASMAQPVGPPPATQRQRVVRVLTGVPEVAPDYTESPPPPAKPNAYKCTAGKKTWVQKSPCPKTYTVYDPVDVDGTTVYGTPVHGFGTIKRQEPVQQQSLDRAELCSLVRKHVSMGQKRESLNAYERNKTDCGG